MYGLPQFVSVVSIVVILLCVVSFGTRLTKTYNETMKSVTTLVLNPAMGHLSSSYTTHLQPSLLMTSRYDFNIYSYESDVSLGLEISQQPQSTESNETPQSLNARFSLTKVCAHFRYRF